MFFHVRLDFSIKFDIFILTKKKTLVYKEQLRKPTIVNENSKIIWLDIS